MPPPETAVSELQAAFLILIRTLVDDMDAVVLEAHSVGTMIAFELRVARSDLGKVIGSGGRTARSLRVLLIAAGMKYKVASSINIEAHS